MTAGNVAHLLAAIVLLTLHRLDRTGSGGKLEAVGAAVAILRALIAAMLGIVAPVDALEELEVGAADLAVEVMVRVRYTLHGDGELQEGQIWEAAMYAAANKVDNIIATIDFNGRQIDGDVENVLSLGNLEAKWEAFGWEVLSMNGHDFENIREIMTLANSKLGKGKPIVIIMKTEMGQGVDFMVGSHKWHGIAPNAEQLEDALKQLEETLGDY